MPENEQQNLIATGNGWRTVFDQEIAGKMSFHYSGQPILETGGVSFGKFSEHNAMISKLRIHQYMDFDACKVESVSVIPFGSEPEIRRSTEFVGNHAKVIVDIDMKKGFPADKISVDKILLPGNWQRIAFIEDMSAKSSSANVIHWENLNDEKEFTRNSESPLLVILLESDDGKMIEVGIGSDLWRWISAEKAGHNAKFCIKKCAKGISFIRNVVCWPEEIELDTRLWRFTWYFSWLNVNNPIKSVSEKSVGLPLPGEKIKKVDPPIYHLPVSGWHKSACAILENQPIDVPCLQSSIIKKHLKRWVRSMANQCCDETVYLTGLIPGVCESASHMERPKKQCLPHLNIFSLLDFWFWAYRQFRKTGNDFRIVADGNYIWKELPSVIGLNQPQPKHSETEEHSEL